MHLPPKKNGVGGELDVPSSTKLNDSTSKSYVGFHKKHDVGKIPKTNKNPKKSKCSMPPSEDGSLLIILFLFVLVLALKEVGR